MGKDETNKAWFGQLSAALAAAVLVGPTQAADAPQQVLEEIIVTAEKRAVNVQETPIAIAAFSAEAIDKKAIEGVSSLQFSVPGLVVSNTRGGSFYTLRGITSENTSSGGESGIAFNLDGVYQSRAFAAGVPVYDMERIEVLRGPQGTLYGRNATGGAINYITKKPTQEFTLDAELLVGDYDRTQTRGAINLPIMKDKAALRVSWLTDDSDGFYENTSLNNTVGDVDVRSYRAHLLLSPTPDIEIMLSAFTERAGGSSFHGIVLSDLGMGALPEDPDPFKLSHDVDNRDDNQVSVYYGKLTWDLGNVIFSSLTAKSEPKTKSLWDMDYTELALATYDPWKQSAEQWTQELQLVSNMDGPVEWIVGLFYLNEKTNELGTVNGPFYNGFSYTAENESTSYAAFGQGIYSLTDRLRLTAGVRYTEDEKDGYESTFLPAELTGLPIDITTELSRDVSYNETTWKGGIEYDLREDSLLYASIARGYKAGGFWVGQDDPYNPEYITAYEVGSKNRFFDDRAQINLSAYYYDYEDMQITRAISEDTGITGKMDNASGSEIMGAEVEFQFIPTPGLDIDGSLSYADAEFSKFETVDESDPELGLLDLSGNKLARTPEWSYTLGAQYTFDLGGAGYLIPRVDYFWRDKVYSSVLNAPEGVVDSFGRTNIRLNYESQDGEWFVDAFVLNLEDNDDVMSRGRHPLLGGPGLTGQVAPPRTYGVRIGLSL